MVGTESCHALKTPVTVFVPPGPVVQRQTDGLEVILDSATAAREAACSCVVIENV